ncbi:MAG TPA: GNAT family N-acetyltransferase [Bdellovibrionota bacterium]|jgi:GNAT superfamily N-acetyltransferase|nr:GNAT family N-acetyltransferase [Bdellovibrionota bacterium]
MTPHIRRARPGDEAAIHEAHMRSIREVCVREHGEEEIRGWGYRPLGTRWVDSIRNDNVWVVEAGEEIYGVAYVRIFSDEGVTRAHLHALYLTPEVIGFGLGRQLTVLMLDTARTAGAKFITLESSITAHEFYLKMGFADTGPKAQQEIAGYPVTYYPMRMELV